MQKLEQADLTYVSQSPNGCPYSPIKSEYPMVFYKKLQEIIRTYSALIRLQ